MYNVYNTERVYVYLKLHVFNTQLSSCDMHWDNCILSMWKVKVTNLESEDNAP